MRIWPWKSLKEEKNKGKEGRDEGKEERKAGREGGGKGRKKRGRAERRKESGKGRDQELNRPEIILKFTKKLHESTIIQVLCMLSSSILFLS